MGMSIVKEFDERLYSLPRWSLEACTGLTCMSTRQRCHRLAVSDAIALADIKAIGRPNDQKTEPA